MNKIALAGCAIIQNDKMLLLHRIKRDCYELPGGKVNNNESPQAAAIREIKEELNCDVEIIRMIGNSDFEEDGRMFSYMWFLARIKEGQNPDISEPDIHDHFKYVVIKDLDSYILSSNMQQFTRELKRGKITLN